MTKMEVVSVRPIPGSNGRGFEVEVREQQESTTPWRRQRIEEIVAGYMKTLSKYIRGGAQPWRSY